VDTAAVSLKANFVNFAVPRALIARTHFDESDAPDPPLCGNLVNFFYFTLHTVQCLL
jgi:hypothetical protein